MASLVGLLDPEIPIKAAERIGSLSTAAVLALLNIYQGILAYRKHKDDKKETLVRLEAWEAATRAEEHQTAALAKTVETIVTLANSHNALSEKVAHILVVLDERLPRRP